MESFRPTLPKRASLSPEDALISRWASSADTSSLILTVSIQSRTGLRSRAWKLQASALFPRFDWKLPFLGSLRVQSSICPIIRILVSKHRLLRFLLFDPFETLDWPIEPGFHIRIATFILCDSLYPAAEGPIGYTLEIDLPGIAASCLRLYFGPAKSFPREFCLAQLSNMPAKGYVFVGFGEPEMGPSCQATTVS